MGYIGFLWGIIGVVLILLSAIIRLVAYVADLHIATLGFGHWVFLIFWILFMGVAEGYRGFQKKFSPRVVARANYLRLNPTIIRVFFAPLFCLALFGATKRRLWVSWSLTLGIFLLVLIVRQFDQPWRGMIDAGVVAGLSWGLAAIFFFVLKSFTDLSWHVDPEVK